MTKLYRIVAIVLLVTACTPDQKEASTQQEPTASMLKALIIDGQNNHYVWPKTTLMMRDYLDQTGLFEVSIHRMDSVWLGTKYNKSRPEAYTYFIETYPLDSTAYVKSDRPIRTSNFSIDFTEYDLVLSNLGASSPQWPEETKASFEKYIRDGGGLVIVHAANNVWGDWAEFNKMIGLGAPEDFPSEAQTVSRKWQ